MTRRGALLFAALSLIWGTPYLLIKIGVESLAPGVVVFGRLAVALVILLPIVIWQGQWRKLRGHWRWVLMFSAVEMMVPWLLLSFAEQHITSSLAGLLIATVPMTTAIVLWMRGLDQHFTGMRRLGLIVGFAGVAAIVGLDLSGSSWLASAAMVVVIVCYSFGAIIIDRKLSDVPSLPAITAAIGVAALVYAPIAWVSRPTTTVTTSSWLAVLLLGLIPTALAFISFFALIAEVGAARSTLVTYLNPAVAVVLGIAILGEPLTAGLIVGFPLVLVGLGLRVALASRA